MERPPARQINDSNPRLEQKTPLPLSNASANAPNASRFSTSSAVPHSPSKHAAPPSALGRQAIPPRLPPASRHLVHPVHAQWLERAGQRRRQRRPAAAAAAAASGSTGAAAAPAAAGGVAAGGRRPARARAMQPAAAAVEGLRVSSGGCRCAWYGLDCEGGSARLGGGGVV